MSIIATCHCGATRIEVPSVPTAGTECNCSFCSRTGAVWAYYGPGELRIVSDDADKSYSASGGMNAHHFCSTCGIQTWGDSPDWSSMYNNDGTPKDGDPNAMPTTRTYAINLRLIDGLDWSGVTITKVDGRNNW